MRLSSCLRRSCQLNLLNACSVRLFHQACGPATTTEHMAPAPGRDSTGLVYAASSLLGCTHDEPSDAGLSRFRAALSSAIHIACRKLHGTPDEVSAAKIAGILEHNARRNASSLGISLQSCAILFFWTRVCVRLTHAC